MTGIKTLLLLLAVFLFSCNDNGDETRPNILWIVVEDMSPHFSSYGEETIATPNIDQFAEEGALFKNAFVSAPVCSPARSAMVSGMYQSSLGVHHHRSQGDAGKRKAHPSYYESYHIPDNMTLLPEIFQDAGYYTALGGPQGGGDGAGLGKSDYNFIWDENIYDGNDWKDAPEGKPFFAQIQLGGGKKRGVDVNNPVSPQEVSLPPYYPDHPVIRQDWADYLNTIKHLDKQVGNILEQLETSGAAENTLVFLLTDHGISHVRGKQFLYDEGIQVPLLVRWPEKIEAGQRRNDLVNHIDIAAASLWAADISIPEFIQGRPFLAEDYERRNFIFSGRDRCDETVDIIRSIRTERFKYIRNFYPHRPHAQANQYKDGKEITQTMRALYHSGELDSLQSTMFEPTRPVEELYDLKKDSYETNNLANDPEYAETLQNFREKLYAKMKSSGDMGLIPEPILEDLGKEYGSKYEAFKQVDGGQLIDKIRKVKSRGERGEPDIPFLLEGVDSQEPSVRYWALNVLGNYAEPTSEVVNAVNSRLNDEVGTVRIAAAAAMFKFEQGMENDCLQILMNLMDSENYLERLYAIRAMETIGEKALPAADLINEKQEGDYEYVRRIARRVMKKPYFQEAI